MSLTKYHQKRSFDQTPEPKGFIKKTTQVPLFCVQKHDASHLHYDFRLEHRGVLLSWAIPKGPSVNPVDKRLAIQVEDHPFDYRNFEGIIPEGNYGAGTVMLWDEGYYTVPGAETKKEIEKAMQAGLEKGHLDIFLAGKKLQGLYSLIRMKNDEEKKQWLFIKMQDEYAGLKNEAWDNSVKTQRTLAEIAGEKNHKKKSPKKV